MGIFRVRVERGGQIIQVANWIIPTIEENNIDPNNIVGYNTGSNYPSPSNNFVNQQLSIFNSLNQVTADYIGNGVMLYGYAGRSNNYPFTHYLEPYGITNIIETGASLLGDKYIFDGGNYIEITYADHNTLWLRYCLADGRIAFNQISLTTDISASHYKVTTIPWWSGNKNKVRLMSLSMDAHSYFNGVHFAYNVLNTSSYLPYNEAYAIEFFTGIKSMDPDNPYDGGGTSEPGGGDGDFETDSDDVDVDTMPTVSAVGSGMATIFSPTLAQLKSLSNVFWGSQWWSALQNTIEGIDKMFVSLGIVPFSVSKGSTVEVTWLGLSITEVYLTLTSAQFYEFDMGSIDLSSDSRIYRTGSVFDYSPFSRLGIYLPFIGFQDLDIDECRDQVINLKYRIDILSGTCVAIIKVGSRVLYQFTGNCITQIPITSQNFENLFTNAVNVGIALGTARNAAAVSSAGEAVSSELQSAGKLSEAGANMDAAQRAAKVSHANASLGNATANAMMGMKPDFNKTGSVSASASLLTIRQPYLYLKTPRQCVPEHYQRYCGFPSNITGKLSEFSGYVVVEDIRLNGLVATSGEVEEIYELLKSGVIV